MSDIERLSERNQAYARECAAYAAGIQWAKREAMRKSRLRELRLAFWAVSVLTGVCASLGLLTLTKGIGAVPVTLLVMMALGMALAARLEDRANDYR